MLSSLGYLARISSSFSRSSSSLVLSLRLDLFLVSFGPLVSFGSLAFLDLLLLAADFPALALPRPRWLLVTGVVLIVETSLSSSSSSSSSISMSLSQSVGGSSDGGGGGTDGDRRRLTRCCCCGTSSWSE